MHALQALDDLARAASSRSSLTGLSGPRRAADEPGALDHRAARPRRGFADRPTYKALHATGRQADAHGFDYVDPRRARGLARAGRLLRLQPEARAAADLDQHRRRGRPPRLRRQPRRPAVSLARARARGRRDARRARRPLRPPPDPQPHEPRARRGRRRLRAARRHRAGLRPRPAQLAAAAHRPRPAGAAARAPARVAYVAGHTHEHRITAVQARRRPAGGFWGIETSSEIDWPIQSRLLEIMDNRDGTLSIFGTLIDHARDARDAAARARRPAASSRRRSPRSGARSPTTTRRPASRTAPRAARRTATSSCCSPDPRKR